MLKAKEKTIEDLSLPLPEREGKRREEKRRLSVRKRPTLLFHWENRSHFYAIKEGLLHNAKTIKDFLRL
jgi:hypothetical protein